MNKEFWREIPAWKDVSKVEFYDFKWQLKNTIYRLEQLQGLLQDRLSEEVYADMLKAQRIIPMNVKLTPYVLSIIDWLDPLNCPIRLEFLPMFGQLLEKNHPFFNPDSLNEDGDRAAPYLVHRYHDKALFLPLTTCPVYCSYCTRSRMIGGTTDSVEKESYAPKQAEWEKTFEYIRNTPHLEDIVISGGDASLLPASMIRHIGMTLLDIPHIRRIRYATKAVNVFPMKFITDTKWVEALEEVKNYGVLKQKSVVVHTHFSHPNEITDITRDAMKVLFSKQIIVRNQAVLQTGVNNNPETQYKLVKKLGEIGIQPYYVYMHDMVPGCEHLRTTLREGLELEKYVRGSTAGFNTPAFVCDLPGGGGKRHVASYEHYDEESGISAWTAPSVKPGVTFYYYDPIHKLSEKGQKLWSENSKEEMLDAFKKKFHID